MMLCYKLLILSVMLTCLGGQKGEPLPSRSGAETMLVGCWTGVYLSDYPSMNRGCQPAWCCERKKDGRYIIIEYCLDHERKIYCQRGAEGGGTWSFRDGLLTEEIDGKKDIAITAKLIKWDNEYITYKQISGYWASGEYQERRTTHPMELPYAGTYRLVTEDAFDNPR